MRVADWIIENLDKYGNCVIPNKLIKLYGIKRVIEEITEQTGYEVMIEKRGLDKFDYFSETNKSKRIEKVPLYIATRI